MLPLSALAAAIPTYRAGEVGLVEPAVVEDVDFVLLLLVLLELVVGETVVYAVVVTVISPLVVVEDPDPAGNCEAFPLDPLDVMS